jgi:hypothetical protein
LNNCIDDHVKVGFFQPCGFKEFLVDAIEGFGVDSFGEVGMFLGPVLENCFEVRTDLVRLFEHFFRLLVQVKLHAVAHNHNVQDETLVLRLVVGAANDILDKLQVVGNEFFLDVPFGFADHVRQEDDLDLVEEEDFADGFEDFEDGVLGAVLAGFGDAVEEGVDPFHVIFGVETEKLGILGGSVVGFIVLFAHLLAFNLLIYCIKEEIKSGQVLF